jgi:hypothetical protein
MAIENNKSEKNNMNPYSPSKFTIDNINLNLSDYTLDEILNLFDVHITETTNYKDLISQIELNASKYIELFKNKNKPLADFFEKAKNILILSDATPKSDVIQYAHTYNPFTDIRTKTSDKDMFNSNNGAGNPIYRQTVTRVFNIDSRFRKNYDKSSSSDFTIDLQTPQDRVIEIRLCDLEIPITYYPISSGLNNNYLWIKYTTTTNLSRNAYYIYVYIPDGNYYVNDLISYMNSTLCLKKPELSATPISILLDLNYNNPLQVGTGTGKVTFGVFDTLDISATSIYTDITIELNFGGGSINQQTTIIMDYDTMVNTYGGDKYNEVNNINVQQTFGWLLGYKSKIYSNKLFYMSESVININGPRYLFLRVFDGNEKNTNPNHYSTEGYALPPDTIARISVKTPAFGIQSENDYSVYTEPRYFFGPVRINNLRVKLIDEYQRIIDLNKNDISFTLRMIVVYSAT